MDDIIVQFKHGVSGGDSVQTEPDEHCGTLAFGIKII